MIKPKEGQGRCLFFCVVEVKGTQELVALLAYKKESRKLPDRLKKLALDQMRGFLDEMK